MQPVEIISGHFRSKINFRGNPARLDYGGYSGLAVSMFCHKLRFISLINNILSFLCSKSIALQSPRGEGGRQDEVTVLGQTSDFKPTSLDSSRLKSD